jgi:hypothetical protein
MTIEPINELLSALEKTTQDLQTAIDQRTQANNDLAIAKAQVEKCQHQKDLIMQQIQVQKKQMDIR